MLAIARSPMTEINWGRIAAYAALFVVAMLWLVEPAMAQSTTGQTGAFGPLANKVTTQTTAALNVGTTILYAAAGLALLVGIAPMLWGQIKVKWIVSCLVAAVLFSLIPTIILAFSAQ